MIGRRGMLATAAATIGRAAWGAGQVRRIPVREAGLVGTFFAPLVDTGMPSVVSLTGAMGGIWEAPAMALAAEGVPTLALATHSAEGRPERLRLLPIEYVLGAVDWLKRRDGDAERPVVLRGWSRGAELALLTASLCPDIAGAIAYAPRCYVGMEQNKPNNHTDPSAVAAFTWRGEWQTGTPLPAELRLNADRPTLEDLHGIAVERIAGPVLFVTGERDTGLAGTTASASAASAMRRLSSMGSKWPRWHLAYPDAGHAIAGPPNDEISDEGGGTVAGNRTAIVGSWPIALDFLRHFPFS